MALLPGFQSQTFRGPHGVSSSEAVWSRLAGVANFKQTRLPLSASAVCPLFLVDVLTPGSFEIEKLLASCSEFWICSCLFSGDWSNVDAAQQFPGKVLDLLFVHSPPKALLQPG